MDGHLARRYGLEGKVALVTGGRQGIGAAVARELGDAGARVAVTSRRRGDLTDLVEELGGAGIDAVALPLDVRDVDGPDAAVAAVVEHFGRLDVLVSNAAATSRAPALELGEAEWHDVIETNLTGAFRVALAAARGMADGGAIVNVSSTYARRATPSRAAYSASKAGLEQLTRCLAVEWAPLGIRVNAVAPGTVATPSRAGVLADAEFVRRRVERIPLQRIAAPDDMVGAVLFLAGPAAAYVTGHILLIDGGFSIT
jgi:2-deoxy-D-gluconate 3-dehydrogenase